MQGRNSLKAMVLAAGVGSRLDPLTSQIPKPLVPVANVPVMEHIVKLLKRHNFNDIYANLHYMPEKIVEYFGTGKRLGVNLNFKHEAKLSGDAGGVRACRQQLSDGTFIVLMGDLLTDADLTAIVNQHKAKKALASIAIKKVPTEDLPRFGVVVTNENGFITGFQEKPQPEDALSDKISTGIYVFEPEVFEHMPQEGEYGFGRQLFPKLVKEGLPVLGIEIESYWSDVGTIHQYRSSNFDALEGLVKLELPGLRREFAGGTTWLDEGAFIADDCSINGLLMVGKNSRVGRGTSVNGRVVVGDNCVIEPNSVLTDSVIWSNTHVQKGALVQNSVIGSNCVVDSGSKHVEMASVAQAPSQVITCA